jgi:hypothetical protein
MTQIHELVAHGPDEELDLLEFYGFSNFIPEKASTRKPPGRRSYMRSMPNKLNMHKQKAQEQHQLESLLVGGLTCGRY